jgi:DNA processing protein
VLVSEYDPGTPIMRHNFIARNRIIAGLADVLLVTEAALKSGSLHTARFALEQGKEVLAIPGNITSDTSEGTNNLLKAGATPVTELGDILYHLHMDPSQAAVPQRPIGDTPTEQLILDLLVSGVNDGAELQTQSQLNAAEYNQSLTMLEITGKIRSLGANRWTL